MEAFYHRGFSVLSPVLFFTSICDINFNATVLSPFYSHFFFIACFI